MALSDTKSFSESTAHSDDESFALFFSRLADDLANGNSFDVSELCKNNPEYESEIRELWSTLNVTRAAGAVTSESDKSDQKLNKTLPIELEDYVLQSEIGRGGMGVVYRAMRKSDNVPVAIKMILTGRYSASVNRQRFLLEAESYSKINHPNIVPIYEVGEHEGLPFLCMKWIDGVTLAEFASKQPLTSHHACELSLKICNAIQHAHDNGILHRDLKPSNIMIDRQGEPYVLDFGLAKLNESDRDLTKTGMIIGTPSFISPEQATGQRQLASVQTDVYGIGAILYFLLTCRPPFSGATSFETIMKVIEQPATPVRSINPLIEKDVESIVQKCLKKSPSQRYSSSESLAKDLHAFCSDRPLVGRETKLAAAIETIMRETHHVNVLANWGLIWIWHSAFILYAAFTTHLTCTYGSYDARSYITGWLIKFSLWSAVFWWLRRRVGPIKFVERQIAHVWAANFLIILFVNIMESKLGLPPLSLSPLWAVSCAMMFLVKASVLSGRFYLHSAALLLGAGAMVTFPSNAMLIFGAIASGCFFIPGLKYFLKARFDSQSVLETC